MQRIFGPSSNTLIWVVLGGLAALVGGGLGLAYYIDRSSYRTQVDVAVEQPIPFSHKHHAWGDGIDCRYCHLGVEKSAFAGIPAVSVCMNCHAQIWSTSPTLAPVRDAFKNDAPIEWNRVHQLPQFVYFNHSIHIHKGVGCSTCHGRVDQMPLVWKQKPLTMEWCLECHRNPEKFVRPREEVFNMGWQPPPNQVELGRQLVKKYNIISRTDCTTCHR